MDSGKVNILFSGWRWPLISVFLSEWLCNQFPKPPYLSSFSFVRGTALSWAGDWTAQCAALPLRDGHGTWSAGPNACLCWRGFSIPHVCDFQLRDLRRPTALRSTKGPWQPLHLASTSHWSSLIPKCASHSLIGSCTVLKALHGSLNGPDWFLIQLASEALLWASSLFTWPQSSDWIQLINRMLLIPTWHDLRDSLLSDAQNKKQR